MLKLGHRVTVLPGVSPCKDQDSVRRSKDGVSREHLVGHRGEIVQIGSKQKLFPHEGFATCPNENMVLVDDQVHDGCRRGVGEMREWFLPEELEVG